MKGGGGREGGKEGRRAREGERGKEGEKGEWGFLIYNKTSLILTALGMYVMYVTTKYKVQCTIKIIA